MLPEELFEIFAILALNVQMITRDKAARHALMVDM